MPINKPCYGGARTLNFVGIEHVFHYSRRFQGLHREIPDGSTALVCRPAAQRLRPQCLEVATRHFAPVPWVVSEVADTLYALQLEKYILRLKRLELRPKRTDVQTPHVGAEQILCKR